MNEEELLKRSAAERDRIFSCYDRGREGTQIDPWEDPAYEVYHTTDRYGFIQYAHAFRFSKLDVHDINVYIDNLKSSSHLQR